MAILATLSTSIGMVTASSIFLTCFTRQFWPNMGITFVTSLSAIVPIVFPIPHQPRIPTTWIIIIPPPRTPWSISTVLVTSTPITPSPWVWVGSGPRSWPIPSAPWVSLIMSSTWSMSPSIWTWMAWVPHLWVFASTRVPSSPPSLASTWWVPAVALAHRVIRFPIW